MTLTADGPDQPCKICGSATRLLGSVDANRCCLDRMGARVLPVSDIGVAYFACTNCGLIFTPFMDRWTADDFRTRIYNSAYDKINPPIPGRTDVPLHETPSYLMGRHIASCFDGSQNDIRIIDFGAGGNPGPTGQGLIDAGFNVHSYEPYRADCIQPEGKYDLIIAIEVFEHCHDFRFVAEFMTKHLSREGVVWIQTLIHPHPAPEDILNSWYIAPRDGHISIHTFWSLTVLFNSIGLNFVQTARGMFAFGQLPTFPNKIFLRS